MLNYFTVKLALGKHENAIYFVLMFTGKRTDKMSTDKNKNKKHIEDFLINQSIYLFFMRSAKNEI